MVKTALVTGFTGQDGSFLTKLLLDKGYHVVGLVRRVSTEPPHRVRGRFNFSDAIASGRLTLEMGDLLSTDSLISVINKHRPQEIYNLAAQSDVHISFMQPEFTIQATFMGLVNLVTALEAVENVSAHSERPYKWKLYQASTSEMFGDQKNEMDENTIFLPNSPYSISKAAAHYYCRYKRTQGKFVSCGILFNHESEIRGGNFVTQKIARKVAELYHWINSEQFDNTVGPFKIRMTTGPVVLELGNLDSVRDWGYAGDYVEAMHAMLQQEMPDDFVVGTGVTHTVREFVEAALRAIDKEIVWKGEGKDTRGYVDGELFVVVSDRYWRPVDVRFLKGDARKAANVLGWKPETTFDELVDIMVKAQIERLNNG